MALLGCDAGDPETQPVDAPQVKLVAIEATTGFENGNRVRSELSKNDVQSVTTSSSFRLTFDRYLLPASASRQSVCLRSATTKVATISDCAGGVFLSPVYDPVKREVVYYQQPGNRLVADTEYQLSVLAPDQETSRFGFRAFDRAPLETPAGATSIEVRFKTAAMDPAGAEDDEAPEAGETFCSSAPCVRACAGDMDCEGRCLGVRALLQSCAFGRCHAEGADKDNQFIGAAEGLYLCTSGSSCPPRLQTAIGKVAHQTMHGEAANLPVENPPLEEPSRFGRALPIIDPENPGNSYLVYKMLAGMNPKTTSGGVPAAAGENDRLRASLVVGMPMPPASVGLSVDAAAMQTLSTWILQGAKVPTSCP